MRPFLRSVVAACALLLSLSAAAQPTTLPHPPGFEYWPGADYDPAVPTTQAVLGHAVGEDIALSADVRRYFDALSAALPDRVRVVDYGRSWEGRPLWYAVVGSAANVARADAVAAAMRELADPRVADRARAEAIIGDMPAVVWLGYSVHGNEPGTTDAAMQTAYHLLASRGDARVPAMLENTLAVIVPVQNPDGRDRFIHANRAARGPFPDGDFLSAERDEPWPGGRMNHYVFDLNRDWFAQTQPETRLLAPELLRWMPSRSIRI
jgi:murein tripeptide amidase MpaA